MYTAVSFLVWGHSRHIGAQMATFRHTYDLSSAESFYYKFPKNSVCPSNQPANAWERVAGIGQRFSMFHISWGPGFLTFLLD